MVPPLLQPQQTTLEQGSLAISVILCFTACPLLGGGGNYPFQEATHANKDKQGAISLYLRLVYTWKSIADLFK